MPLPSPQPTLTTRRNGVSAAQQGLDKTVASQLQDNSVVTTPKLSHAGPKIFDKVRAFEERRASVDLPGGAGHVSSESHSSGKKPGGPSKEDDRILQDAAQKRAAFKQRASSLEDKMSYSQRVQNYQNKFAEELQRIKKLVGKPCLKKAFSTEQLPQSGRLTAGKLEPIPPQVVKKLEARERALKATEAGERGEARSEQVSPRPPGNELADQSSCPEDDRMTQADSQSTPVESTGKTSVTMETAPVHQLPGQPLPTATRKSLSRFEDCLY